jgi:hypothetical protein
MLSTVNGSDTRHNSAKQFTTLFFVIMSKSVILSLLAQGNTGAEILSILDALVADNVSGFDYIESPQIEAALGIPTLGEVAA